MQKHTYYKFCLVSYQKRYGDAPKHTASLAINGLQKVFIT